MKTLAPFATDRKVLSKIMLSAISALALHCLPAMSLAASSSGATNESTILHNRIKPIEWKCDERIRKVNDFAKSKGMNPKDPQALLLSAVRGKPIYNQPLASLGWMDMHLRSYGNKQPLTLMTGEPRNHVLQLATLVNNDYIIAAQMQLGLSMVKPTWPKEEGIYVARLIVGLTDSTEGEPALDITIAQVKNAFETVKDVSPMLRGYAHWAIRAFAYDDDVAIETAMTGMCQSNPPANDKAVIEKAIKASQFKPS